MQAYKGKILLICDSTFVSPAKKMKGLLTRGKGKENCVRVHYCIATSEDGKHHFGILDFNILSDPISKRHPSLRNESDIWIFTAENCINLIRSSDNSDKLLSRCIFIADREGDEFELMDFLATNNLDFIIRSKHDRKILFNNEELNLSEVEHLSAEHGAAYEVKTRIDGDITKVKVKRSVLRNISVTPPASIISKNQKYSNLNLNVVMVKEVSNAKDPLVWRLLTREQVNNAIESEEVVVAYTVRWCIEEVNKAAKTGVRVEERQFTELDHYVSFLAMAFVIAWRMVALRTMSEVSPATPIKDAFTEDEVGYMNAQAKKLKLPMKNVNDAIMFIAKLGGFTNRYKQPGWQILWQGWMKFYERVEGYLVAKEEFGGN